MRIRNRSLESLHIFWGKIVIDEALPFLENGQLLGVSTGKNHVLWPALLEKAVRAPFYYVDAFKVDNSI